MTNLIGFLRVRLDEDEAIARAAIADDGGEDGGFVDAALLTNGTMLPRFGEAAADLIRTFAVPRRVLREIEAKRRMLARGGPFCTSNCDAPGNEPMDPASNWTVPLEHHYDCGSYEAATLFAAVYADHPDYREEWRP